MKKILLYTTNNEKAANITELAKSLGITVRMVLSKELTRTVNSLLGNEKPFEKGMLPPFFLHPEVMVISGLNDVELEYFLAQYKEKGIAPIPLKAVATPYNLQYSMYELTLELMEEHKALKK